MKIDFTNPSGTPAPLPPAHEFYTPTYEWCLRHKLHIDEAEVWVELHSGDRNRELYFNKDNGMIRLYKWQEGSVNKSADCLFIGYLPNEEALEAVIKYTNWNA